MLISILVKVILIRLSGAFDTETSGFDTGAIDVKVDGFVLKKKIVFKISGLSFSSKLDCNCCIISIDKTAFKKMVLLIRSAKFLAPEVAFKALHGTLFLCLGWCS